MDYEPIIASGEKDKDKEATDKDDKKKSSLVEVVPAGVDAAKGATVEKDQATKPLWEQLAENFSKLREQSTQKEELSEAAKREAEASSDAGQPSVHTESEPTNLDASMAGAELAGETNVTTSSAEHASEASPGFTPEHTDTETTATPAEHVERTGDTLPTDMTTHASEATSEASEPHPEVSSVESSSDTTSVASEAEVASATSATPTLEAGGAGGVPPEKPPVAEASAGGPPKPPEKPPVAPERAWWPMPEPGEPRPMGAPERTESIVDRIPSSMIPLKDHEAALDEERARVEKHGLRKGLLTGGLVGYAIGRRKVKPAVRRAEAAERHLTAQREKYDQLVAANARLAHAEQTPAVPANFAERLSIKPVSPEATTKSQQVERQQHHIADERLTARTIEQIKVDRRVEHVQRDEQKKSFEQELRRVEVASKEGEKSAAEVMRQAVIAETNPLESSPENLFVDKTQRNNDAFAGQGGALDATQNGRLHERDQRIQDLLNDSKSREALTEELLRKHSKPAWKMVAPWVVWGTLLVVLVIAILLYLINKH